MALNKAMLLGQLEWDRWGVFVLVVMIVMCDNYGMAAGRPTKYSDKYIKEVDKYLKENTDEVIQIVKQSNSDKGYEMFENKLKVKLPTIEGFARHIGVNKTTLYEWEENHPKFSNALELIREEQRSRLLNSGLSGDYNSTIAKLILASNHGMSDKQEIDHTSGGKVIKSFTTVLGKAYGTDDDTTETT